MISRSRKKLRVIRTGLMGSMSRPHVDRKKERSKRACRGKAEMRIDITPR